MVLDILAWVIVGLLLLCIFIILLYWAIDFFRNTKEWKISWDDIKTVFFSLIATAIVFWALCRVGWF